MPEAEIDLNQSDFYRAGPILPKSGDFMKEFVIQALAVSKISEAYSFANLAMPGLERGAWQRYASHIVEGNKAKAGILVIRRTARAHICGLVGYCRESELLAGRVLHAKHLAAIDMLDQGPILSALLHQLAHFARRSHCRSILISLPDAAHDRRHLYTALLKLRPKLAIKCRFGVVWDIGKPDELLD